MNEPRRPAPETRPTDRIQAAVTGAFAVGVDRWRDRQGWEPTRRAVISLVVAGTVLVCIAAVWGWLTWSSRSEALVDDQLPFLVTSGAAGESLEPQDTPEPSAAEVPSSEPTTDPSDASTTPVAEPTVGMPASPVVIVVHVSGAVAEPGVVELPGTARVYQAVDAVGGADHDADLDRVNLAAPMLDGERIHIPRIGQDEPPTVLAPERSAPAPGIVEPAAPAPPQVVDLNSATTAELEQLPGVGPTIAQAIASLREARGPYATVEELLLVGGIGPAKLEALRAYARVESR